MSTKNKSRNPRAGASQPSERIQKVLARWGLGSRRQIETWIEQKRLQADGKIVTLGDMYKPGSKLLLNGKAVRPPPVTRRPSKVLIYNKPEGVVCTRSDPQNRPTVFDHLPPLVQGRWVQVGRLDINSTGLMIFTTDGDLAHRLMHPSTNLDREYTVRVYGNVDDDMVERLRRGVKLDGRLAKFTDIQRSDESRGDNHWFAVVVMEGRNREVRRLWESQGVQVTRLKRVRFGPVYLPSVLRRGKSRELTDKERSMLFEDLDQHAPENQSTQTSVS